MNADPTAQPLHLPAAFSHLWLFFVVIGLINIVLLRSRLRARSAQRPDLAEGYRRFFVGSAICLLLPWLVMGVGIEIGGVPNFFSFLSLRDRNPYVIAFYAVITVMVMLGCYWIFLRRGAEFFLEHPGTLRNMPKSPVGIRVYSAFMTVFWLVMLVLRWKNILPTPPLR